MEGRNMSRVGRLGEYDVVVYSDDEVSIPHFHVIDSETKGGRFNVALRLNDLSICSHAVCNSHLDHELLVEILAFMEAQCRNVHYKNNYEYATSLWQDNN